MRISLYALVLAFGLASVTLFAGENPSNDTTDTQEVEFFDAMKEGLIDASIITHSSLDARITVRNKTDKTLRVNLPENFAAVHVVKQGFDDFGGGGGGSSRGRGGRGGGQNQATGGGLGGAGGGGGGQMGIFNLPPEKVLRQNVKTVCLEHGKREPARHLRYELRPLEEVTDKEEVHILCSLVGSGSVDQQSAQAAVWHYNNGLSWEELAAKQYKPRIDSSATVPYFNPRQILYAMNLGKKVEEKVAEMKKTEKKADQPSHYID